MNDKPLPDNNIPLNPPTVKNNRLADPLPDNSAFELRDKMLDAVERAYTHTIHELNQLAQDINTTAAQLSASKLVLIKAANDHFDRTAEVKAWKDNLTQRLNIWRNGRYEPEPTQKEDHQEEYPDNIDTLQDRSHEER